MPSDISSQDRDLAIRTIMGEVDPADGDAGRAGVAGVILNRLRSGQYGDSIPQVVLQRGAFEPWSTRRRELQGYSAKSPDYQAAGRIFDAVASGDMPDPTGGATHFYSPGAQAAMGRRPPDWSAGDPTAVIGGHRFYAPNGTVAAAPQRDILDRWGVSAPAAAPATETPTIVPAGTQPSDDILSRWGVSGPQPKAPAPAPGPEGQPGPSIQEAARQRITIRPWYARALPSTESVVEGIPVAGPAIQAASAAVMPGGMSGKFATNLEIEREVARQEAEAHPVASALGNLLGGGLEAGVLAPSNLGGRALGTVGSTLGARLYGGAAGGASIGGLDALLRGQDPITGAEVGGGIGAAGVLGGEAVGAGTGAAVNALRPGAGPLAEVNSVGRQWLADALANETPASIVAAQERMGPQGFLSDLNPALTNIAAGIANNPQPPASTAIAEAYRLRQAAQPQIIENALTRAMGPRVNIEAFRNAITENRAAAADPLYQQWRTMQVHPTDELKALIPRLESVGAFDEAEYLSHATGVPMTRNFFTPGTRKDYPTTETWDLVKRGLDSKIEQAFAAGNKTRARALVGLKNELVDEIERTPAGAVWRQARQEFASRSAILDQIQAGQDTFLGGRAGTTSDELAEELQGLSGPEKAARVVGARGAADRVMRATANGDTRLRTQFLAPENQDKLRLLLGDAPAQHLIDTMEQQRYLSAQHAYVAPQSGQTRTAPLSAAIKALEPPPIGHYNPSLTEPFSWIPASWIDAIRLNTVLQGGREASHAAARQQIAPVLLSRGASALRDAQRAIEQEALGRAAAGRRGLAARLLTTAAITGPGSEATRLRAGFGALPALAGPAQ